MKWIKATEARPIDDRNLILYHKTSGTGLFIVGWYDEDKDRYFTDGHKEIFPSHWRNIDFPEGE